MNFIFLEIADIILFIYGLWLAWHWIQRAKIILWFLTEHRLSRQAAPLSDLDEWPRVSIIVPARDEEESIERCLRSLLSIDYPALEVVAIDDASKDQTGEIMDNIARSDDRLKIIHKYELPEDWLGKQHAMHKGTEVAQGDYLLFTDADVSFSKETIKLAIKYMVHNNFDNINVYPQPVRSTFWGNSLTDFQVLVYLIWSHAKEVSNPKSKAYGGMGQFIMVKRSAYDRSGGMEKIKNIIVDDFALARLFKFSGAHQDMLLGNDLISFPWSVGLTGFMNVLKKNAFAALGYSIKRLSSVTFNFFMKMLLPYIMVFVFHDWRILGYVITLGIMHFLFGFLSYRFRSGWISTVSFPFTVILFLYTFWRSALITLCQKGVRWRDRFFPLDELKKDAF